MRSVTGAVLSVGAAGTRRTEQPHNGCFLPVTFLQPELFAAVSSPSPKGPGVGGISAALEKDPRSSHPSLVPLLACKAHFWKSRE